MAEQQEPRCKLEVLLEFTTTAKPRSWGFEMFTSCHVLKLFRELRAVTDSNARNTLCYLTKTEGLLPFYSICSKIKFKGLSH